MKLKNLLPFTFYLLPFTCLFTGCGIDYQFKTAEKLKENGKFVDAITKYQLIVEKKPDNPRIPEALYKIARIYQQNLENIPAAKKYYRQVINNYSTTEWANYAAEAMLEEGVVDYFPLIKNSKWIEVDSDTFGRYMTAKNEIVAVDGETCEMTRNLYTKGSSVSSFRKYFKKTKNGIYETAKNGKLIATLLLLPIENNKEWPVGNVKYTVVSKNETVTVLVGKFTNCIKIKKQLVGTASYSNEYYAPEVGKILTTQSAGATEKRITELKEFNIPTE
ncbi:MAG: tetratricopeptide repeat protein [Elusimicrobiota bacterium]